jgi:hypothetical protein
MLPRRKLLVLLPRMVLVLGAAWGLWSGLAGAEQDFTRPAWVSHDPLGDFPKPKPIEEFSALKVLQADGTPYRLPQENWAAARQRIARDAGWAEWYAKEKATVDEWISRPRDRAEWVCGWWHDFVSPKDGSYVIWTSMIPGEEVPFLTTASDPRVELTPKIFGGWVYRLRSTNIQRILQAAHLFALTDDRRYAEWASSQIDFYAKNYAQWPRQTRLSPSRLSQQSLDDAVFVIRLCQAVRLLEGWVTPERRAGWRDHLFLPEARLLGESFQVVHNIACWLRSAQAHVALLFDDHSLWREAIDGEAGLRAQLAKGLTRDYLWYEQSFGYNYYVGSALLPLLEFAALRGRAGELQTEAALVQNLLLAPLYLRFPDNSLPNPADWSRPLDATKAEALTNSYRVLPSTAALANALKRKGWDTLIDAPESPPRSPILPVVTSKDLESTRMALLRRDPWQVFFHYGQLTHSHSQHEALNFSVYFRDIDISHDAGTVGYGSPLADGYYRQGLAHNALLVDGEGQESWQRGELIRFDGTRAYVEATQPRYRTAAAARRSLSLDGETLRDVATITTSDGLPHLLGLTLHVQGHATLSPAFVSRPEFSAAHPKAFGAWRSVAAAEFRDDAVVDVTFAKGLVLKLRFALPGKFTLFHAVCPDVPPHTNEVFYLEAEGRTATFTTQFSPSTMPR